ncbi:Aldo/keto reductase subgroup family and NADP-dependent oxidoreductase domain-containing protein [Strongyloides ratti]|uniref:Aldo/keto reductase subgroup family and NADP-dependent oxidoreductase domain-containing protein n=1 Tax=Strongyloides ratti TaxID=34506 RepID=A0A090LH98_STRRB|nr:Aldo/keto reductase subgroup family and NADP-dependent oxidoreductase domain-containing protein [Strongyloides ratti]CEF67508.1 Aldo/keto reductase subgroup family and NADP-dependent oxidoreductase domain-containing protein [Strongyloides ratti]
MGYVNDRMPLIGFGTFQIKSSDIYQCLDVALQTGYRFIDTAQCYGNEKAIGDALKILLQKYNLKRSDIFITTKVAPKFQGKDKCRKSILKSLEKLQTDYIDLVLIHWPGTANLSSDSIKNSKNRKESWQELEEFYRQNVVRSIGVSNYNIVHLEELLSYCKVKPEVNQCEYHPYFYTYDLVSYCKEKEIHFQAYSSFGSASNKNILMEDEQIKNFAKLKNKTTSQVLLAWSLSQGISVLPRSKCPSHIIENFESINLKLTDSEIKSLVKEKQQKFCWDPSKIKLMLRLIAKNINKVYCKRYYSETIKEKSKKEISKGKRFIYSISATSVFLLTHGALYLRRRFENQKTDSLVDTIPFDDFLHNYLLKGKVSSIVYQVPFSVADVYLEEKLQNTKLSEKDKFKSDLALRFINKKQEYIVRTPDIRVKFEEDSKAFKEIINDVNENMKKINEDSYKEINLSINDYPSKGEFFIIFATSTALLASILLV